MRASHILLKTDGKDEAAVRKQAEEILEAGQGRRRLRRAREEGLRGRGSKVNGGDLDYFAPRPHGAGVRERGVRDGSRDRSAIW